MVIAAQLTNKYAYTGHLIYNLVRNNKGIGQYLMLMKMSQTFYESQNVAPLGIDAGTYVTLGRCINFSTNVLQFHNNHFCSVLASFLFELLVRNNINAMYIFFNNCLETQLKFSEIEINIIWLKIV